jgi:gliding motility-associated-like protein
LFICISHLHIGYSKNFDDLLTLDATISGGGTFCQYTGNQQITFSATNGNSPFTFTYNINGGTNQTITTNGNNNNVNLNFSTNTNGNFTYNLVSVEDDNGDVSNVNGSITFNITAAPDNILGGTGSGTFNGQPVFTACNNTATTFTFTNTSSTSSTINTNYTIDWGDGSPAFTANTWSSTTKAYDIGIYTLTYTIEGSTGCNTTRNYLVFVGSNPAVGFGNPGNTDICNDQSLTFPITGTTNNTVGTIYEVIFNDGSPTQFFDQQNVPASITHTFQDSSCDTTSSNGSTTFSNSYSATIIASNPCNVSSVNVVPIYVSAVPEADFDFPDEPPCVNTQVCIEDLSTGSTTNGSNTACSSNPNIIWEITPNTYTINSGTLGDDFGSSDPDVWLTGSELLCLSFNTAGTYTVTQTVANRCGVDIFTDTICIEPETTPAFTLDTNDGCTPLIVNATNTTDESLGCKPFEYEWTVNYSSEFCGDSPEVWSFINGTNSTSENPSFNFETPGTYTIILEGTNFCTTGSFSQQVIVKKPPEISIDPIDITCDSSIINPSAVIESCTNDLSSVIYDWQFPGANPSSSNLENPGPIDYGVPGTYTFTLQVTNDCGTSSIISETITIEEEPIITNTDLTQEICSGTSFDDILITSNIAGTTFTWSAIASPGVTGFTPNGLGDTIPGTLINSTNTSPGSITYTVTPSTPNCTGDPVDFIITINPAPSITTQPQSDTVCLGGTPNILSTNTAATGAQYQWYSNTINSNTGGTLISGATNPDYLPPTNTLGEIFYYCEITFTSGGCSTISSQVASINVLPAPSITTQPIPTQNLCVGGSIPAPLSVNFENGAGNVSYQWFTNTSNSNTGGTAITGEINPTFTPPSFNVTGNFYYYVEVTFSGNGCNAVTSNVAEIVVFDDPVIDLEPIPSQTLCQNSIPQDLEVQLTGSNGTFNYQWFSNTVNSNTGGILISGATNSTFTPPTGIVGTLYYYCEITQSTPGCSTVSIASEVIITTSPIIENQPISEELCLGEIPNDLNVSFINGVGTPTFQWFSNTIDDNSSGTPIAGENLITFSPPASSVGTNYYYCVITFSSGGCSEIVSDTAEIIVNETPAISDLSITICSGDTFNVLPDTTNGDIVPSNTSYIWTTPVIDPAGSVTGASAENNPQNSISQTLINNTSSPSIVTYTVTPTAGICNGNTFNINVTVNPSLIANITLNQISCFQANDGSISAVISGGIPFTTGDPYLVSWSGPGGFTSSDATISNLSPGNYTLTITDQGGCPFSETYIITEPDEILLFEENVSNVSCFDANDGEIDITVTGGSSNYSYNWTLDGNFFSSDEDISSLAAGTYEITVSDDNNCISDTLAFIITEPDVLEVSVSNLTNIECFGEANGTIEVNVSGGTPIEVSPGFFDYSYSWNGPNGFTSNLQNLTGLLAGTYTLTITDLNGCQDTIDITLTQPDEIIISVDFTEIECYEDNDASITITNISGGVEPYSIQWSNFGEGMSQTDLSPGNYTITVTDAISCDASITIDIAEPPIFTINPVTINQISCFGANDGSISLSFQGGQSPIDFEWEDDPNAGVDRNNLGPGSYTINISDAAPCTISETFTIFEPNPIALNANITNALDCDDPNSGDINLFVSGGTAPFEFLWSNGETSEDLINIPPGNYQVEVTDANDCSLTQTFEVTRPPELVLDVTTETIIDCEEISVYQIFTAQASGGVPPFTFSWSSGEVSGNNNQIMTTIENGTVILDVTDSLGCTESFSFDVFLPEFSAADFVYGSSSFDNYGFYSQLDPIQFTNTTSGEFESISWNFGDGNFSAEENPTHIYLNPGTYIVTQTITYAGNSCENIREITIIIEDGYKLIFPNAFSPNQDGLNDLFRPSYIGLNDMQLNIYDTWGSLIYSESGDIISGWDGKINGELAENGNYYFTFVGKTIFGKVIKENGALTLIL